MLVASGFAGVFRAVLYERVIQGHENPCFDGMSSVGIRTYRQKYRLYVGMSW